MDPVSGQQEYKDAAQEGRVPPGLETSSEAQAENGQEKKKTRDLWEPVKKFLELLVAAAAIAGLIAVYKQLDEMKETNRLTRESNALTRGSNEMTRESNASSDKDSRQTLDQMRESNRLTREALDESKMRNIQDYELAREERKQRQMELAQSRYALERAQRAELGIDRIEPVELTAGGEPLKSGVTIRNSGRTTATEIRMVTGYAYLTSPIEPNHPIVPEGRVVGSVTVLAPGATTFTPLSIAGLTESGLGKVRRKELTLYVFGELSYVDGFGNKRLTRFCGYHEGDANHWNHCPNNNEVR